MHGVKRVAIFCIMTTILPTILIITPLYLRHSVFADVKYPVAESDILAIIDGISSVFCEAHTLKMNTTFNAFQLSSSPELSHKRKHIRLKKSMILPDDTLEYWGFYLLKGATVVLKVCSRYEGSRILVVRGEKNLRTCGLMNHNLNKFGATLDKDHNQVKVTFETVAQEITVEEQDEAVDGDDKNNAAEDVEGENIPAFLGHKLKRHKNNTNSFLQDPIKLDNDSIEKQINPQVKHRKRHARNGHLNYNNPNRQTDFKNDNPHHKIQQNKYSQSLKNNKPDLIEDKTVDFIRTKRQVPDHMLDTRISHGGSAINFTTMPDSGSASSFETELLTCYDGQILLTQSFSPSHLCTGIHYLEKGNHMEAVHEVASDGYYYYIFYSDNDIEVNDLHAVFDIRKPTYQYANISKSKGCLNQSICTFPLQFWSDETVIVEVPTRDGIEHEDEDASHLVSTCHPRMTIYIIFPIAVLFLILGCSFL